jgi:branched-chain amino acid transport system ATP-binding protein
VTTNGTFLKVEELRAGYGAMPVLHDVSFSIGEGQTAVMFGLNGAGKTTTVNTIAGLLPTWSGQVLFEGEPLNGRSTAEIVARGVALVPEGRRVFPDLSVRKNLELGGWTRRSLIKEQMERVFGYFPRLEERADQLAGTLSGGEQQMLAIGRALMSKPRLLLVDEASLGLSPKLAETVFQIVKQINTDGTTVIMVEQNVGVLPYADRALVMEKGVVTFDGTGTELERSGNLRQTYLG